MVKQKWYQSKFAWIGLILGIVIWLISINTQVEGLPLKVIPLGFAIGLGIDYLKNRR